MAILYVDLIDACHMKCPTCVRGTRLLPNSSRRMPIDLFERIVVKAKSEGYEVVGLYNWTEPFLNAKAPQYIGIVKGLGLKCDISTTLSFSGRMPLVEAALRAGLDTLIVSVSGYTQDVYEIDHRGGDLALVKRNLEQLSRLMTDRTIKTRVVLRFLKFAHNIADEPLVEKYARQLGFSFEPLQGVGMVDNPVSNYANAESFQARLMDYSPSRPHERPGEICPLIMDTVAVDAQGIVSLCCANPNFPFMEIGPYTDLSQAEIVLGRYTHPICPTCCFPRRQATSQDRERLMDALAARLGGEEDSRPATAPAAAELVAPFPRLGRRVVSWLGIGRMPLH